MAKLTEQEKRELLEDASSPALREDFAFLKNQQIARKLTPIEFIKFLGWLQQYMTEDPKSRGPIRGDVFIL